MFIRLLISLIVLHLGLQGVAKAESLSLLSDDYCPYICNPHSAKPGYMVEILKHIFEKQGIQVQVNLTIWSRAIKEVRNNKHQGLMAVSKVEAPDFIYPEKPLGSQRYAYFAPKSSKWVYNGLGSFTGARIGVVNGYWYGEYVDRFIKNRHKSFIPFSGERPLDQMLASKELDAFIEDPVVLNYALQVKGLPKNSVKNVGWVSAESLSLYVAFSPTGKKSKAYAHILSKGLDEIRRNGELRRILNRYNLDDWGGETPLAVGSVDDLGSSSFESSLDFSNVFDTRSL